MQKQLVHVCLSLLVICLSLVTVAAQQTAFTYQGKLTDNGSPASGSYDLQFGLFDSASGGVQIGSTQTVTNVLASGGVFTVTLDFGTAAFPGTARFLEISTRPRGDGAFTLLMPRQQISSTPYAVRSLSSATADVANNAQQLAGVAAAQYVQTSDSRLADARTPTTGSANYIQNTNSQQTSSNFNISGNGTTGGTLSGNLVNTATQYNINGNRALGVTGAGVRPTSNTFAGIGAGALTVPNATSTAGHYNAFFGSSAGGTNTTGGGNAYFGAEAGTGSRGDDNSFFGFRAGIGNVSGSSNTFVGRNAGTFNSLESFNTFLGAFSRGNANVNNATAIGYLAQVNQSNSLVLGSINGVNGATADTRVGIGTTTPAAKLHVEGNTAIMNGDVGIGTTSPTTSIGGRVLDIAGSSGVVRLQSMQPGGQQWEWQSTVLGGSGAMNLFNASNSTHLFTVLANGYVGIGAPLPTARLRVGGAIGTMASFASVGDFAIDDSVSAGGRFIVKDNGNVGIGTNAPATKLDVDGGIRFSALASGGNTQLCWNNLNGRLASCSSSLRYKTDLRPFNRGLNLINRLHPITFKWKSDQSLDLGLGAEDVAKVEPLLVTKNEMGQVEGVKYDRLSAVFINAFKEQQNQIEQQRAQIESQADQIRSQAAELKSQSGALGALQARLASLERSRRHQPQRKGVRSRT
jgi:hypothetical protein